MGESIGTGVAQCLGIDTVVHPSSVVPQLNAEFIVELGTPYGEPAGVECLVVRRKQIARSGLPQRWVVGCVT